MTVSTRLHTCVLCEAVCGIVLETDGERILSVRGDRNDPFSAGHICPKAAALVDVVVDPDRVRTPLRRVGDRFEPVSWDAALGEAAERIADVQRRNGRGAVALYFGNPTVHSHGALLAVPFFSRLLGSRSRFSATSVDQLPQQLAAYEMFGHQLLLPVPDIDRTRFLLVVGANPAVSNGSLMTAPGVAERLRQLRARGGRLVVVDPRRTETAALADDHVAVRPGGDAALLASMLHVILGEGLDRLAALTDRATGLDEVRAAVRPFAPARVATRVGVEAERIRDLARDFARAESAVCHARVGACTQPFGGVVAWLVNVLDAVTGNLDRPGGAMISTPAADLVALTRRIGAQGSFDRYRSRVRGLPEFGGELPAAALAEEIDTPGAGQVRALVTFAGNPVLSSPNGARLERALPGLEFMVSIDIYRNETTRHANLILPTSFGPERDHHDLAFYALAVRNAARYVEAAVPPPPGVRHDWQVLADLGLRIHHAQGGRRRKAGPALLMRVFRALGPRRTLDLLLRLGPHRLSVKKLLARPHGIDLGPLRPGLLGRLETPDRKVRLAPPRHLSDLARVLADLDAPPPALALVGRRGLRSNNSWLHNSARLVKGPPGCTLLMHPDDAIARGLADGAEVRVRSRAGEVVVPLRVTAEMAPGVVSLPHGWGHGRLGAALAVAAEHPGASVNDLTDEERVDPLSGTAAFNGVPVEVGPAP